MKRARLDRLLSSRVADVVTNMKLRLAQPRCLPCSFCQPCCPQMIPLELHNEKQSARVQTWGYSCKDWSTWREEGSLPAFVLFSAGRMVPLLAPARRWRPCPRWSPRRQRRTACTMAARMPQVTS